MACLVLVRSGCVMHGQGTSVLWKQSTGNLTADPRSTDCRRVSSRPAAALRYLWAGPTTALGLLASLPALWRGHANVVDGVLEVHGPLLSWLLCHATLLPHGAAAMTLGHVVIARDRVSLDATRAHERVHVRQ